MYTDRRYDVLVPVGKNDVDFIPKVVCYVKKNLLGLDNIYILSSKKNISKLQSDYDVINGCVLLDEDSLLPYLNFSIIGKLLKKNGCLYPLQGWYMQQFLKLGFAMSPYAKDFYVSWDADTLPLKPLKFFENGSPLFTIKEEYHKAYFQTIKSLLGIERVVDYSFIAEHMVFKTSIVKELITEIDRSSIPGNDWVEKCIAACDFNGELEGPFFSEFETYGTFCLKRYPNYYHARKLNTFRSAGMIKGRHINEKILERLAFDLDIASFEIYDAPFPYNFVKLRLKFFRGISKMKRILSRRSIVK